METAQAIALLIATLTTGLMAGVFGIYANAIMPGLHETDDRIFIESFQSMDRAIINPVFMVVFFGALVAPGVAAALHIGADEPAVLLASAAAFLLYLGVVVITVVVNVPANDRLKAAGRPDNIVDLSAVRAAFDEARWTRWNAVRTLLSLGAFGCSMWALVEFGRAVR